MGVVLVRTPSCQQEAVTSKCWRRGSHAPPRPQGRWTRIQDGTWGSVKGFGVLPRGVVLHECASVPSLPPATLTSISLCAQCLSSTSELCILMCFLFLHLSSLKWPLRPRLPICAFTMHLSEFCFCWFRPDSFRVPYFRFLKVRIWLAHVLVLSHFVSSCPVYGQAALGWSAHPQGLQWKEGPEEGAVEGGAVSCGRSSGQALGLACLVTGLPIFPKPS